MATFSFEDDKVIPKYPIEYVEIKDGKEAHSEDILESLIFEHPDIFPIYEISGGHGGAWIPLARQIQLKGHQGILDILATDGEGNIYILECKLNYSSETKTLRSQINNYAAGFSEQKDTEGMEKFWDWLCGEIEKKSTDGQTLENILKNSVGEDGVDGIIESMKKNFEEDRMRLVFAVDKITEPLRIEIEWWNQKANVEHNYLSFALEVKRYGEKEGDKEPSSIVTQNFPFDLHEVVMKNDAKTGTNARQDNDMDSWMKQFEERKFDEEQKRKIIEFKENLDELLTRDHGAWIDFGTAIKNIRMMPKFGRCNDRSAIGLFTGGKLVLQFGLIQGSDAGPELGKEFEKRINEIDDIRISLETRAGGGFRREPWIKLETWLPHKDKIISILEEVFVK